MDAAGTKRVGPLDVDRVVRVASVDDGVAGVEVLRDLGDHLAGDTGRDHHPHRSRSGKSADQLLDRRGTSGDPLDDQRGHDLGVTVAHHALDAVAVQATNDVRTHSSEPDHSQLHRGLHSERGELTP